MSNGFRSSKNISFHEIKTTVMSKACAISYDDDRSFLFYILYSPNTDEVKLMDSFWSMADVSFPYDVHVTKVKKEYSDEVYKRITINIFQAPSPSPATVKVIDLIYKDGKLELERVATSEDLLNERAADALKESDILFLTDHIDNESMSCMFVRPIICGREVAESVYNAISASFPSDEGELSPLERALLVHDTIMQAAEE